MKGSKRNYFCQQNNKTQHDWLTKYNTLIYKHREVANEFHNSFGTIAENVDKNTLWSKKKFPTIYKTLAPTPSHWTQWQKKKFATIISVFRTQKARQPNSISNYILKEFKD